MHIHHLGFFTPDLKTLTDFYTSKLGFTAGEAAVLPETLMKALFCVHDSCRMVKLSREGVMLEVFEPETKQVEEPPELHIGCNHWGLAVSHKEEFIRHLKEAGVPLIEYDKNGKTVCLIQDPDGNSIELYEVP